MKSQLLQHRMIDDCICLVFLFFAIFIHFLYLLVHALQIFLNNAGSQVVETLVQRLLRILFLSYGINTDLNLTTTHFRTLKIQVPPTKSLPTPALT